MKPDGARTGEILLVKCVKDGIPNRDPLRDSDARRLFGEDDGRISLSDVSIKRDVRDYLLARFPDGGPDKNLFTFVRKERTNDDRLLGRETLALTLLQRAGRHGAADTKAALMASAFDARVFGVVFSVKKKSFNQCGPVQFAWAHSLHPVETKYVQGTVVMPSEDAKVTDLSDEDLGESDQPIPAPDTGTQQDEMAAEDGSADKARGATQGTIWTTYLLPFAVFAMPAVINAAIAAETGMTAADTDVLLEALWKGTLARQARGRGIQQPLLLLHVEYKDPFFRIGFLEDGIRLQPGRDAWLGGQPPTSLRQVVLDVNDLAATLKANEARIARARLWRDPNLRLDGEIAAEACRWPE